MFVFTPVLQREDYPCVFVIFFDCVLPWASLALSLHEGGDKWWVTPQAGGQTPWPNYLSVFPHFLASFSLSLSPSYSFQIYLWVLTSCLYFSLPVNLSLSVNLPLFHISHLNRYSFPRVPHSLPSIYLSLSLMNISHRNAIYRCDIVPPVHPSGSAFSSARFIQSLSDWGWVSCRFQLSSILRIKPFFFQSLMQDRGFTLICFIIDQLLLIFLSQRRNASADLIWSKGYDCSSFLYSLVLKYLIPKHPSFIVPFFLHTVCTINRAYMTVGQIKK